MGLGEALDGGFEGGEVGEVEGEEVQLAFGVWGFLMDRGDGLGGFGFGAGGDVAG